MWIMEVYLLSNNNKLTMNTLLLDMGAIKFGKASRPMNKRRAGNAYIYITFSLSYH